MSYSYCARAAVVARVKTTLVDFVATGSSRIAWLAAARITPYAIIYASSIVATW